MKALTQQDIAAVNGAGSLTVKYTTPDGETIEVKYEWP